MKKQSPTRLNFDFPPEAHTYLKVAAAELGVSIRELATQAILEKLDDIEMQRDIEAYDRAMRRHKANDCQTISHRDFKRQIDL
jgi:putative ubiquitin-RnfH superfamily antitoxin RatB of RatAB toxin-antitoxin module